MKHLTRFNESKYQLTEDFLEDSFSMINDIFGKFTIKKTKWEGDLYKCRLYWELGMDISELNDVSVFSSKIGKLISELDDIISTEN